VIAAGDTAPGFTLPDQDGNPVSLGDFAGRTVVLYFYPRANSPVCTAQAWRMRDRAGDFGDAVVLGVSPDPVDSIKRFHDRLSLNFTLLADADHAVCKAYGVWALVGARRATFIIDAGGTVAHVIPRASPRTHAGDVLAVLDALATAP
jgi:peroxiredoxin Q/BCP